MYNCVETEQSILKKGKCHLKEHYKSAFITINVNNTSGKIL